MNEAPLPEQSDSQGHSRYIELRDPNGETYEDGSYDTIISAGWPALYPTRESHVELHFDGWDMDFSAEQLRWLIENGPTLLGWLEARS